MDSYVQELLTTIEALTESKNKLQTYMLEQVGEVQKRFGGADLNLSLSLTYYVMLRFPFSNPSCSGLRRKTSS